MPILVLFFFSCVTKIGIFLFFIKLLTTLFFVALPLLQPFLLISSLGSIVFGALGAFNQRRLKRFVAYTSINQTGFMLLGLSCASLSGCLATITYLLIYLPALVLFFTAIIYFSKGSFLGTTFLKDLFFKKYGVSVLYLVFFSVSILSMAGFPPLGGFAAKFGLFNVLLNHAFFFSSITVLLTTVISSFYYLKIIRDIWFCLHKTTIFYNYECYTYTFYAYSQRLRWLHLNWRFSVIAAYLNILLNMLLFLFITCFYLLHNQFIIFCTYFSMSAFDDYFFIIG
jgi:NADH-quinone oxidoreductase subunit N